VPPPPFLTKAMPNIAQRFLRKWWLNSAFASLRDDCATQWPADSMHPPDIHGEFMPTNVYFNEAWRTRLSAALERTQREAREFVDILCESSPLQASDVWVDVP